MREFRVRLQKKKKRRVGPPLPRVPLVTANVEPRGTMPRELTLAEKRQAIFDLRLQGHALADIAKAVGLSLSRVGEILSDTLKELSATTRASAEELRAMEVARLDKLLITHWPMRMSVKVSELIVKILERRHKLAGLDVTHTVHTGLDGGPIQVAPALDLTKLNDQELEWLEIIVTKAGNALLAQRGLNGVDLTAGVLEHEHA